MSMVLWFFVLAVLTERCYANVGDAFGLINRVQTFCELDSITTASKLADKYNSLDEVATKEDRMGHEYIIEHLGFGWEYGAAGKAGAGSADRSHNPPDVKTAQVRGGWTDDGAVARSYKPLEDKWIYFYGDHTLRHIASAFLHPSHGKEMFKSKEWTTSKCTEQGHRGTGSPAGADAASVAVIESSPNHHTGHNYKAKTCHFPGYGANGRISYDWKHTPFDEYDAWFFGPEGYWGAGKTERKPDILVIQVGHSTCLPSSDPAKSESELQHSEDTFNTHAAQVDTLFDTMKAVFGGSNSAGASTTVIVSTAPRALIGNSKSEICMWKLNRIIARAAHRRGFIVLEREEMEHRVMFKLQNSEDLLRIGVMDVTEPPMAEIVSTSLLSMIACLARNVTEPPSV